MGCSSEGRKLIVADASRTAWDVGETDFEPFVHRKEVDFECCKDVFGEVS